MSAEEAIHFLQNEINQPQPGEETATLPQQANIGNPQAATPIIVQPLEASIGNHGDGIEEESMSQGELGVLMDYCVLINTCISVPVI